MSISSHDSPSAEETIEIIDAVYRFAGGQDYHDRSLFQSAFAEDATLDFTHAAGRIGQPLKPFRGRSSIVEIVLNATANLDTTHSVSNARVLSFDGSQARLVALVEAQHLPRNDHHQHLLLKNKFSVDLVREPEAWVIRHLLIENIWWTGEPAVLFPPLPT